MTEFIPFHRPSIGEEEIQEVVETLRSGWLTTGPRVARFERAFQSYTGSSHAVAVNSATAGLHLTLAALNVGPGDEVITSPMTFCATVHAILHVGARPVLADIGPDGNISPDEIRRKITLRTRAIIPVHIAGLPCEMDEIRALARRNGVAVIEDAAHAAGARYRGRPVGAGPLNGELSSDAVVFSFYATKNLTTGEGGMVTTHLSNVAESVRSLSLHGLNHDAWNRYGDKGDWHYDVAAHGFKYNLSDLQAAIGIHQLQKLESFVDRREELASIYNSEFADVEEVEVPPDNREARHAWHLYILRLNLETLNIDRAQFISELRQKGIGTSVHFIPIPLHSYFARLFPDQSGYQRALELYPRIISLPLYPALSEEQVRYVAGCVRAIVAHARKHTVCGVGASSRATAAQRESYE